MNLYKFIYTFFFFWDVCYVLECMLCVAVLIICIVCVFEPFV